MVTSRDMLEIERTSYITEKAMAEWDRIAAERAARQRREAMGEEL